MGKHHHNCLRHLQMRISGSHAHPMASGEREALVEAESYPVSWAAVIEGGGMSFCFWPWIPSSPAHWLQQQGSVLGSCSCTFHLAPYTEQFWRHSRGLGGLFLPVLRVSFTYELPLEFLCFH